MPDPIPHVPLPAPKRKPFLTLRALVRPKTSPLPLSLRTHPFSSYETWYVPKRQTLVSGETLLLQKAGHIIANGCRQAAVH